MLRIKKTAFAFAAMIVGLGSGAAFAAPQILAVAASNAPIPFHCEDGVCEVEVSAMCLQEDRRFPDSQTAYTPHDAQSFTLVYEDAAGNQHRVVAGDMLTIRSKRSFTAVRVSLPEDVVETLGAGDLRLDVAGGASLVPDRIAHDFYPQTETDIAEATGPLREMAAGWLDANDDRTHTSRLISGLLNDLPRSGSLDTTVIEDTWDRVSALVDNVDPGVMSAAGDVLNRCAGLHAGDNASTVRRCLERNHDGLLYQMNVEYWEAVKAGS